MDDPLLYCLCAVSREQAEMFFEGFSVPAMYISMQAVLSLYAAGKTTGVVLDVGDGVTHAVPVYEGFALPHAITRSDVAGREVTDYFQLLLRRAGYPFHTTAEREVVREMKEIKCYVAKKLLVEKESRARTTQKYRLPDNNEIELGTEIFEAPEVRRPCRCRVALSIASFVSSCSAGFRCR